MCIRRVLLVVLIVVVSLGAFPGFAQKAPSKRPEGEKPGVVAVVNGSEISLNDLTRELYRMERAAIDAGNLLTAPQVTRLRTEALEGLVRQELLYQESKKAVRVTDAEVAGELQKLKGQFQNPADFEKAAPSLRGQVERALAIRKYIDAAHASKVVVTDAEIRSYYDGHRDSFRQPEQVKASSILIKVDSRWDEAKKAEARRKIEDIRKKALEGQDFASLARTYSEDLNAPQGGDMGYVRQGLLLKPIEEALFALKPGEVSDVVETGIGYHLAKAIERKPETTVPFENVKDRLRTLLKEEKARQEANAYVARVREKAAVKTFLPAEE